MFSDWCYGVPTEIRFVVVFVLAAVGGVVTRMKEIDARRVGILASHFFFFLTSFSLFLF